MNKHQIVDLLLTNDTAVARALVALTDRQTADEQASGHTRYHNGRGFRPCHARMGTSMAQFYRRNGYLSPKQVAYWRQPQRDGFARIAIYAGQLEEIARQKRGSTAGARPVASTVAPVSTPAAQPVTRPNPFAGGDVGNLCEEEMILKEQLGTMEHEYGMYQDSDDEVGLAEMRVEIDAIRRRLELIGQAIRAS